MLVISGLLEFILGNTFPFVVFASFGMFFQPYSAVNREKPVLMDLEGGFWLAFGCTLQPALGAAGTWTLSMQCIYISRP